MSDKFKFLSKLMTPIPIIQIIEQIKVIILGFFLCKIQKIYGTTITFIEVKNAFLLAVVIIAP